MRHATQLLTLVAPGAVAFAGLCLGQGNLRAATALRIEAEAFDRYDNEFALFPPRIADRPADICSGGKVTAVRSPDTGVPTWVECDVDVPTAGVWKLLLRSGGNDSRQAGLVSVDGGEGVLVVDAQGRGDVTTEEMRKEAELLFVTTDVGNVLLAKGRHRIRIAHSGKPGYSNSFGIDYLELQLQPQDTKPTFKPGRQLEPVGGKSVRRRAGDLRLTLKTDWAFHGQHDEVWVTVTVSNFGRKSASRLRCTLKMAAVSGRAAKSIPLAPVGTVPAGGDWAQATIVRTDDLTLGEYVLTATLESGARTVATDSGSLVVEKHPVPTWVRRGRLLWQASWTSAYPYWVSVETMLDQIRSLHAVGASVIDNQCCQDYYHGAPPSYPQVRDFEPLVNEVHRLGMKYIWYQTSVTTGESFWYRHRDWSTSPPFYHCGWLSMSPAVQAWSDYLADDLATLVTRSGIDGVMLDNSSSTEWADVADDATFRAIGRHLTTLRERLKAARPNCALIPNYGLLSPLGMKYARHGWDAQITEGPHPAPRDQVSGHRQTLRTFVTHYAVAREYSGKPVWPLMYAPESFGKLCMAACAAARVNPASGWGRQYLPFIGRYAGLMYAPNVTELPEGYLTVEPDDEDTVVVGCQRIHPSGKRDWIFQVVNATMRGNEPVTKPVSIRVNMPKAMPTTRGFLLKPESAGAEPVAFADENGAPTLRLNASVWSVIVLADEVEPCLQMQHKVVKVARGEAVRTTATIAAAAGSVRSARWTLASRVPPGLTVGMPKSVRATDSQREVPVTITTRADTAPGVYEVWLDTGYRGRTVSTPVEVEVTDPVLIKLKPDWFELPAARPHTSVLTLTNTTSRPWAGKCFLSPPKGFGATPAEFALNLAPSESLSRDLAWRLPKERLPDFFAVEDHLLRITVNGANGKVIAEIPLRLTQTIVRAISCTLGSPGGEVLRTGAGDVPLSQMLGPLRASEFGSFEDAMKQAVKQLDEGPMPCLWLRIGGRTTQLGDRKVIATLEQYVQRGGALVLQENVFAASEENRAFFASDVCPIEGPYSASEETEPWTITAPDHPAISVYAKLARLGDNRIPFPQPVVHCKPKPWTKVLATTASGEPAIIVSADPKRPVAYIAGLFKGNYLDCTQRYRKHAPKDQMTELITLYIELMRWVGMEGVRGRPSETLCL